MSDGKSTKSRPKGKGRSKKEVNTFYGLLDKPNIRRVTLGKYTCDTWYGNAAYFNSNDWSHSMLGYEYSNKIALDPSVKRKSSKSFSSTGDTTTTTNNNNDSNDNETKDNSLWIDQLYVCEFCFAYTMNNNEFQKHRACCTYRVYQPTVGRLVYRDDTSSSPYIIREVRGFQHSLFAQNLCLFGKLFLDDKSVYYNIDYFNFYIIYGIDNTDDAQDELFFKPMGFFSKELLAYDNDNNLACICIFPPFQRRHLGSLLIEFSYELAKLTPGQYYSGPEFPLSPFGKVSYLNYWSKKLATVIYAHLNDKDTFTLKDLATWTGFRKEDILLTLEYMKLLQTDNHGNVQLLLGNFQLFCKEHNIDPIQEKSMIKEDCLLI
ncbi:acyl-CoA N-acyltransferase [Scheffersomyces amazonensis]|uniref:acyl-CoA N-acyltransferase n=1 Tax=Scheffersomyces amazonensis TaxID=1078765 RepID=UPI00315D3CFD